MSDFPQTVVLDCEGVSALISQDHKFFTKYRLLQDAGAEFVISANTILEVSHAKVSMPRLHWVLSQLQVEPVTEEAAKKAAELLKIHGLHGHKHAIDASVAEVALRQPRPVAVVTSDVDDMSRLCGDRIRLIPV